MAGSKQLSTTGVPANVLLSWSSGKQKLKRQLTKDLDVPGVSESGGLKIQDQKTRVMTIFLHPCPQVHPEHWKPRLRTG